jgi:hypothetical protein
MLRHKNILLAIGMAISFFTTSCGTLENTERQVVDEYHFAIEPETILQSIARGEEGIFSPMSDDTEVGGLSPQLINWDQNDYLLVVDAFHKFVWGSSVQDWSLNYMSFSLLCNQVGTGFQWTSFSFFQEKNTVDESSEIEHQIDIYPERKLINAWEFAYDSRLARGEPVEITTAMLTADEALMIAESSGGLERRVALSNDCEISVILSPNSVNYRGWIVLYAPDVFSITINPITGKPVR